MAAPQARFLIHGASPGCMSSGQKPIDVGGARNLTVDNLASTHSAETGKMLGLMKRIHVPVNGKNLAFHRIQANNSLWHMRQVNMFNNFQRQKCHFVHSSFHINKYASHFGPHLTQHRQLTASADLHAEVGEAGEASVMGQEGGSLLSNLLQYASVNLQVDDFWREIAYLALPAMMALAIDPTAQLMETAYVARIGPVELAAVGVSMSIFNLVTKLFNIPLINVTTSFVAEDDASTDVKCPTFQKEKAGHVFRVNEHLNESGDHARFETSSTKEVVTSKSKRQLLPAVSTALIVATLVGVVEAAILTLGAGPILNMMGVPVGSPMRVPAKQYLALRVIGAPAFVLAQTVQGVFRGFKDTKTPLYATMAGNTLNILLGPILIFFLGLGVSGAAIATVISQYFLAFLLLWNLSNEVVPVMPKISGLRLNRFLKSGCFLFGKTMAALAVPTFATSMAARQGAIAMAGHQILVQIWMSTSLISDSLGLAVQALLASAFARGNLQRVKCVTAQTLQICVGFGLSLGTVLFVSLGPISKLLTTDAAVQGVISNGTLFVAASQPLNALAFLFDGIYYGSSDFSYAAYSMMIVAGLSCMCIAMGSSFFGLSGIWIGLALFMAFRAISGFLRLGTASGPWQFLR
eukprot:c24385_g1_i1 orf=167-2071(+)